MPVPEAPRAVSAPDFDEGGCAGVCEGRNRPAGGAAAPARPGTTGAPTSLLLLCLRCGGVCVVGI